MAVLRAPTDISASRILHQISGKPHKIRRYAKGKHLKTMQQTRLRKIMKEVQHKNPGKNATSQKENQSLRPFSGVSLNLEQRQDIPAFGLRSLAALSGHEKAIHCVIELTDWAIIYDRIYLRHETEVTTHDRLHTRDRSEVTASNPWLEAFKLLMRQEFSNASVFLWAGGSSVLSRANKVSAFDIINILAIVSMRWAESGNQYGGAILKLVRSVVDSTYVERHPLRRFIGCFQDVADIESTASACINAMPQAITEIKGRIRFSVIYELCTSLNNLLTIDNNDSLCIKVCQRNVTDCVRRLGLEHRMTQAAFSRLEQAQERAVYYAAAIRNVKRACAFAQRDGNVFDTHQILESLTRKVEEACQPECFLRGEILLREIFVEALEMHLERTLSKLGILQELHGFVTELKNYVDDEKKSQVLASN